MRDDLALITEAAREAGRIALEHFHGETASWDKADGSGPVTEADLEVDGFLKGALSTARLDYGWLSEESADTPARRDSDRLFIIDPIDGTRAFIEGSKDWGISIAVIHDGTVVAGVVHMPERDALYAAALGQGATLNGAEIATSRATDLASANVLATRPNMQAQFWAADVPAFRRSFRSSLAYRMCLVAEGRYDAMLTLRPTWEWDVAAGCLIVSEAGGTVTDGNGRALRFNNATPQVAGVVAGGGVHPGLLARLARNLPEPQGFTLSD